MRDSHSLPTVTSETTCFIVILCATLATAAASGNLSDLQVFKKYLITTNYDKGTRPYYGVNSTVIVVDAYVETFGKVEEVNMETSIYMYFRQTWKDPRVANVVNSTVELLKEDISLLWRPDTFCYNSRETNLYKEDKDIISRLRVYPDGNIYYSRNTHLVGACDMNLRNFPIDVQNCSFKFGSYGFSRKHLDYYWKEDSIIVEQPKLAQFTVTSAKTMRYVQEYKDIDASYVLLKMSFLLQRSLGYYIIQLYLPCILLVLLSWIVFFMSPENGGDRLTVGITCILTIVFLLGYVNGTLPKVSYVKGVDWYVMTSFLFIFLSLTECVLVERLSSADNKEKENKEKEHENEGVSASSQLFLDKEKPSIRGSSVDSPVKHRGRVQVLPLTSDPSPAAQHGKSLDKTEYFKQFKETLQVFKKKYWSNRSCAQKLDIASRVIFPLAYVLYNISYWYVYLNGVEIVE